MGEVVKHRNRVLRSNDSAGSKAPSPPLWLRDWSPHEPVPVDASTLNAALAKAELWLEPAIAERMVVMLEDTLELYGVPENWERVAKFYLEALADVPEDLIDAALRHVRLSLKFFPKPAELRKPILDALNERKATVERLRLMQDMRRRGAANLVDRRPPTQEECDKVSDLVQRAIANLRKASRDDE